MVQVNGCTKMEEPVREIHRVRQVSPDRGTEDVALPGVFAPYNSDDNYAILDSMVIGAEDLDGTNSMLQVLPPGYEAPTFSPTNIYMI